jgi:hypothetical protein
MLDPYEELSPESLIKRDVRQICSPGLLGNTSVKGLESLDLFHIQDDFEVMAISSLNQADPSSVWVMLVIDVANDREVVQDDRDILVILINYPNRAIILSPS